MIFDEIAPYYDHFIDDNLNDFYIKTIQKHLPKESTIIDIGCGNGRLSVNLAKLGYIVTAIDISDTMLEYAMNKAVNNDVHIRFFIHNILDPLSQTYDGLLMTSDVINNLHTESDVLKVFKNVSQSMTENSIYMFDFIHTQYVKKIHNYHQDILLQDDLLQWSVRKTNKPHQIQHYLSLGNKKQTLVQTTFPFKTFKLLLEQAGFKIIRKKRTDERYVILAKLK